MKRYTSYLFFLSCLMLLTPLYAGTQTLTTYYPAPQGNYKNMTVTNNLNIPVTGTICTAPGNGANSTLCLANQNGLLQVCDKSGCQDIQTSGLWTGDAAGTYIDPVLPNVNVGIGYSGNPNVKFGVLGNANITGAANIGAVTIGANTEVVTLSEISPKALSISGPTTVAGALTIGTGNGAVAINEAGGILGINGPTKVTGTLDVTGTTTLGSATINTLTVSTNATVNGNTNLGNSSSDVTTVTGNATVSGTTTTQSLSVKDGTVTLGANSSTSGTLAVAYSGGKYYAEYGP